MFQIVLGTGGRSQVHHAIHGVFDGERTSDVLVYEREALLAGQVRDIAAAAGKKVVQRRYFVAFRQQAVAHMRPDKTRGSGNDDSQIPSELFILSEACAHPAASEAAATAARVHPDVPTVRIRRPHLHVSFCNRRG